jgi:hypothetical protein
VGELRFINHAQKSAFDVNVGFPGDTRAMTW